MPKLNVGMVLDNEFTNDLRVENEVISLVKAGYNVFIFCFNFGHQQNEQDFHGACVIRINASKKIIKKMRALTNTIFNIYPYYWSYYLVNLVKMYQINVLHIHDLYMFSSGFITKKKLKNYPLTIVGDLHENYPEGLKHYRFSTTGLGKLLISIPKWEKTEIEWIKKLDYAITVIEEAVERYSNLGIKKEKFTVVPNYVNLSEFNSHGLDEEIVNKFKNFFVVSYIGAFDYHRGLESVVKSIPYIVKEIPQIKFVLVGDGANKQSLIRLAEELNVSNYISFEGWQPAGKLPSYIEASDICLIPHLKTNHTDNTIPHKLFQYMFMKKPVIATNCNPIERIIRETEAGLVYSSNNEIQLAENIKYLFNNPSIRSEMSTKGHSAVIEKYNWEYSSKNLVDLYRKIESE
ncbi:MAG TPA: glycosyltransferase [Ignavibacteria bacterium]|nr:glycosyltransferase [Ignavibacteria bacterium]